ncbi:MAG: hypothetical protein U0822_07465 [Anaerolineae bacterium]
MNNRQLGLAGMLGGLAFLAIHLRHLITGVPLGGATIDRPDDALYLIFSLGALCIFWGMYRASITGAGWLRRAAVFVPMLGFALMIVGSLLDLTGLAVPTNNGPVAVGWLLIMAGTLLVALLTLFSPVWSGWRKFAPLLCVLLIPPSFLLGPLATPLGSLPWILLGYAVFSSPESMPVRPAAAEGSV